MPSRNSWPTVSVLPDGWLVLDWATQYMARWRKEQGTRLQHRWPCPLMALGLWRAG